MTRCINCESEDTRIIFKLENFPIFPYPLPKESKREIRAKYPKTSFPLQISYCKCCTHFFQSDLPPFELLEDLYNKYYFYPSPLKANICSKEKDLFFEKLLPYLGSKPKKILEIGCFDGYLLYNLKKQGHEVIGCDPSRGADIGKEFGIEIKKEYFNKSLFQKDFFDVVIFRNLIEHVTDPIKFLNEISGVVKEGGIIAVETPDCGFDIKNGSLRPFHHQHISNFTVPSLKFLLLKNKFNLVHLVTTPDSIIAFAKKEEPTENLDLSKESVRFELLGEEFSKKYNKKNEEIHDLIQNIRKQGKSVVVWGAGGFTSALLSLSGISPFIEYIVDSDKGKWDKEYLDFDILIVSPDKIKETNPEYLLIGSQFVTDIVDSIKNKYKLNQKIIILHPRIKIID